VRILCPTYWYPEHEHDTRATYVHDINRHLAMLGHEVLVVTPQTGDALARECFDGVDIVRFPAGLPEDLSYGKVAQSRIGRLQKLRRLFSMARYIRHQYRATVQHGRAWGPDIIHAHWAIPTGPAAVASAMRLGRPSVITMHGGDVYVNREQGYDFPVRWYVRPVLRQTLRRAGILTAISDDCRQHALNAGASAERIQVVMNGADLQRFSPGPALHAEYGDQMIFACRQLIPRKGIRFLIQALARIKDDFPAAQVVVAGDGIERADLESLARELGVADRVHLIGWVPNEQLPGYFRSAALSVIPSIEEGFGVPAAEAMGCEIPVVATDAGGLPEVVEHGVTGLIVGKSDVEGLATAISKLLRDAGLRNAMGRAGRARALARFDWMSTARTLQELYASLAVPRAAGHG